MKALGLATWTSPHQRARCARPPAGTPRSTAPSNAAPPSGPRTLRVVQRLLAQDDELRLANRDRLGELVRAGHPGLRVFSAHDPVELAAFVTG